ncbi:MAG: hypothetical protein LBV01_06095 [Deltaproteobacteria bacterium]|jgi:hypothetical protein|nr:hypothetical protein [Deltaproteobacteria bacterium]
MDAGISSFCEANAHRDGMAALKNPLPFLAVWVPCFLSIVCYRWRNKIMVKRFFCIAIFVIISLSMAGCATNLGIYDTSVPQNQLCTLKTPPELFIRQFNGNKVNWNQSFPQLGVVVQIPAGRHTFLIDYDGSSRSYTRYATDIRYSYTFEAGKTYVMEPIVSGNKVFIDVKIER